MSCPRCGSVLPPHDGVCLSCGTGVPVEEGTVLPGVGPMSDAERGTMPAAPSPVPRPPADETIMPVSLLAGGSGARTQRTPASTLSVGQPFGSRYLILKVLGEGGMGAVYQAWDESLGVAVALKVIRPEVLNSQAEVEELERRFKRELLLARKVTHRHVVR